MAVPALLPAPQQLSARLPEPVEGAHHDEVAHSAGADGAAPKAVDEIVEGGVDATGAFGDDRLATILAEVADVVEADAHAVGVLNRQGCRGFEIPIPWPQVGRLGEETGQKGGPRRGLPIFGRGAVMRASRQKFVSEPDIWRV